MDAGAAGMRAPVLPCPGMCARLGSRASCDEFQRKGLPVDGPRVILRMKLETQPKQTTVRIFQIRVNIMHPGFILNSGGTARLRLFCVVVSVWSSIWFSIQLLCFLFRLVGNWL